MQIGLAKIFGNQFWRLISGPLVLMAIPLYLNPVEQGFWFTFIGLSALTVIADLGFTSLVLQFAAHEASNLKLDKVHEYIEISNELEGLRSLYKFTRFWALRSSAIVLPSITAFGLIFIEYTSENSKHPEYWGIIWAIYCLGCVISFLLNVTLSFLEGLDLVGEMQFIRLLSAVTTTVSVLAFLLVGFGLFSLCLSALLGPIIGFLIVHLKYKNLIKQLMSLSGTNDCLATNKKIKDLMLKYAMSWGGGYLTFSIYTPIIFAYYGAVEAGRAGITLAIVSAIFTISNSWLVLVLPKVNILIAKNEIKKSKKLYFDSLIKSLASFVVLIFASYIFLAKVNAYVNLADKVMLALPVLTLVLCYGVQIILSGYSLYIRSFKIEPFTSLSIFIGCYVTGSTILIANTLSIDYIFMGFLSSYLINSVGTYSIYKNFKKNKYEV